MIIQFTLQSTTDGSYMTGQAANTTVYISKDGGAFVATTNAVAEIGRGLYKVELTAAESAFSTLVYNPICTGAQNNLYSVDAPTDVSRLATSSALADVATTANGIKAKTDNLPTVPAAKSDIPSVQTIQSGLATSSDLSAVASNVSAVKTKTDNLPAQPAAADDVTTAKEAIIAAMPDVSGLSTFNAETDAVNVSTSSANAIRAGLSTFDPTQSYVIINPSQAASMQTATGFATPANVTAAQEAIIAACSSESEAGAVAEAVWTRIPRTLTSDTDSGVVYCTTAQLYAHWTQPKIDAWANGSQTNIDNAILSASRKIDADLNQAASTPFQPVPADIRDLAILAAGVILARQAGDLDDPGVTAAIAYYQKYIEDYNYTADN